MKTLSKRDIDALHYINSHRKVHKYAPSIREMMVFYDTKSNRWTQERLRWLVNLGVIDRTDGVGRSMYVTRKGHKKIKEYHEQVERTTSDAQQQWATTIEPL
jgi:SOS-response transcriptional repressor LexA